MKKKSLLKVLGIFFIAYILLSWIIPSGYFASGKLVAEKTAPLGIFDIIRYPIMLFSTSIFLLYGLVIILIGGLYGVLNKIGAYSKFVESIVSKNKGKGNKFVIFTIILFTVLSSLSGLTMPLLVLVPFFVTVLLLLGYNKPSALLATFGAILVGNIGCTYGFNIAGYTNYFLNTGINTQIIPKIIFFVVITALLIVFVCITNKGINKVVETKKKTSKKKDTAEEKVCAPLYEKAEKESKSVIPIIVIVCVTLALALVGMYNWEIGLKVNVFNEFHEKLMAVNIKDYPIVSNIFGNVQALGYWSNYELLILLVIATLLIGWIYNVKCKDFKDGFVKGVKEMLPVACYMIFANILFLLVNSGNGTIFATIADFFFKMTKGFNGVTMTIISAIGSVFFNDFPYMLNSLTSHVTTLYTDVKLYPLIAFIMQAVHGIVQLLVPTSMILFGGLKYFGISFKEWFKYIWKFVVGVFVIAIIFMVVIAALI